MFSFLILASSTNENDCNIPPSKGATLDKPSEMMAFSLSNSELRYILFLIPLLKEFIYCFLAITNATSKLGTQQSQARYG